MLTSPLPVSEVRGRVAGVLNPAQNDLLFISTDAGAMFAVAAGMLAFPQCGSWAETLPDATSNTSPYHKHGVAVGHPLPAQAYAQADGVPECFSRCSIWWNLNS